MAIQVALTAGPPNEAWIQVVDYGSGVVPIYYGWAKPLPRPASNSLPTISSATKANPGVLTCTAHKLPIGSKVWITVAGVTGTGWTALNTTFLVTVTDANSLTTAIDTSGFGTLGGTILVSTVAPLVSQAKWAIQFLAYDSSGNMIYSGMAEGSAAASQIWDNRALLSYS